ncbi:hypothetical protein Pint_13602 [Pistacia integerrima]|uniref:Uncharacterized protein n=1 Tax=Pistacia integerrima TaxID=434235 RepID=A0ACC0YBL2_9ROSI|nr:hypothetical protein Pint_13602 [Pistacia integerrima]
METTNSFKSYSKVDELQEQEYRRRTRKRLIIITVSTIILIIIIVGALVGTLTGKATSKNTLRPTYSSESITAICNVTQYPASCDSSIASLKSSSNITDANPNPEKLFQLSMQVAVNELTKLLSWPDELISSETYSNITNDPAVQAALDDCKFLFQDAVDHINDSITSFQVGQMSGKQINDIRTWLSTAITNQDTCLDGIYEATNHTILPQYMKHAMRNATEATSNCLAIASNILTILLHYVQTPNNRKLLTVERIYQYRTLNDAFPEWIRNGYRKLLQEENPIVDVIVAKDGSGDFETINEAIKLIPKKSTLRFVVYVKEGVYEENVNITKDYWNVMIYGDGMNKTIVSGSLNKIDGTPTFFSGTFIAAGRGFIARDMGFRNTAGPEKHQAVALRSSSDKSVFYRCSFEAYQDTLYTHSNRQFYRDCQIIGTIDFIFGNAAVVFQNCSIQPRQPMPNQFITITAQSKTDPNQNTGMSIQRAEITPFDNLTATTYLGRPWKDYATTLFMQSDIGGFLDPEGWAQWVDGVDPPNTILYAEYQNTGPGSVTDGRVRWDGVRPNITEAEALKFSVESFIQGSQWLPDASVMFDGSL